MKIGKLSNELLNKIIFNKINYKNKNVIVGPGIGQDCGVIDFGDDVCVISTDPITATVNDIGSLSVHISCNDIASSGIRPFGILITILAPPNTQLEELEQIMNDILKLSNKLQIEVIGGHTEITDAVNRVVISTTCLGKGNKKQVVYGNEINEGDVLIMTKYAAIEGTTIIYNDFKDELTDLLNKKDLDEIKYINSNMSVIDEGVFASKVGAKAMHDVTEGGIFGAAWEMAEGSNVGIIIYEKEIPILNCTKKIVNYFKLNPYRLISSGVMLIAISKSKSSNLINLLKSNNINSCVIGEFIKEKSYVIYENQKYNLEPPESDELYKVYI